MSSENLTRARTGASVVNRECAHCAGNSKDEMMARWYVEYRAPDGSLKGIAVDISAGDTAQDVKKAIEEGKLAEVHIQRGTIVSVHKREDE